MVKKELTPIEAWEDFWAWVKTQPIWKELTRHQKQALYRNESAAKVRTKYQLGVRAIEAALNKYAPGRYTFQHHTTVTVNEKS